VASLAASLKLSVSQARDQFRALPARRPVPGRRQVTFLPVETLLCLAAAFVVNSYRFGATAHRAPEPVPSLARLEGIGPDRLPNFLGLGGGDLALLGQEALDLPMLEAEPRDQIARQGAGRTGAAERDSERICWQPPGPASKCSPAACWPTADTGACFAASTRRPSAGSGCCWPGT
jgi:hypothetical protein